MLKIRGARGAIKIRDNLSAYDINGMCGKRVKALLCRPCPRCAKNCYAKICIEDLLEVCTWWHGHMTVGERSFLLNIQYGSNAGVPESDSQYEEDTIAERTHWHLCGARVCSFAFCTPLGISRKTGSKYVHGAIDMRTVNKRIEAQQFLRVHQFFLELYHSAAVSLPREHYMNKGSCIIIRYWLSS